MPRAYHRYPAEPRVAQSPPADYAGRWIVLKLGDILKNVYRPHTAFPPEQEQYSPRGVGAVDSRVKTLVSARSTQPDGFSQFSHGERLILHSVVRPHNLPDCCVVLWSRQHRVLCTVAG
jgi:hypothetical protein